MERKGTVLFNRGEKELIKELRKTSIEPEPCARGNIASESSSNVDERKRWHRNLTQNKNNNSQKQNKVPKPWLVGDRCCFVYNGDGLLKEAEILSIDMNSCVVSFVDYNEEEINLGDLRPVPDVQNVPKPIKKSVRKQNSNSLGGVNENAKKKSKTDNWRAEHFNGTRCCFDAGKFLDVTDQLLKLKDEDEGAIERTTSIMDCSVTTAKKNIDVRSRKSCGKGKKAERSFRSCNLAASNLRAPGHLPLEPIDVMLGRSVANAKTGVDYAQRNLKRAQDSLASAKTEAEKAEKRFRSCNILFSDVRGPGYLKFQPGIESIINASGLSVTATNKLVELAQQGLKFSQDSLASAKSRAERAENAFRSCNLAAPDHLSHCY